MKRIRGAGKLVCVMLLALWPAPSHLMAQANVQGQWTPLPYTMPIRPIHATLVSTGMVLVVAVSGNYPRNKNYQAAMWDLQPEPAPRNPCLGMLSAMAQWP